MNKKLKNIAFGVCGIIFLLVFSVFVIRPLTKRIKRVQQDVRLAEAKVRNSLTVQNRKEEIVAEYGKYKLYLTQAGTSERQRVGSFLKELERISQEANLSVTSLNPQKVKDQDNSLLYSADFKAEGDIEEILFFFSKIQESKLLVKVDKFSLSPKDRAANILSLDAKIGMSLPQE